MQNYKVEVQNHSEGMEAQDLFLEIGFKKSTLLEDGYPKYVVADQVSLTGGKESGGAHIYFAGTDYKKITMPELRDMVTLKQKEYLVKTNTGYVLQVLSDVVDRHDGIIEVPEGANKYIQSIKYPERFGFLRNGSFWDNKWIKHCDKRDDYIVLWQRESLNDQVASAEEYRKSFAHTPKATLDLINNIQNAFEKAQGAINAQNAMAKLFAYPQYISGVAHGKEFIVKPNQKKKDESDLVNDGQSIMDGLANGFSEGGFIPKSNHSIPAGLVDHGFSGFTQPEELPFVGLDTKFATEYPAEFFRKDDELDGDLCVEYVDNAWNKQIGGDHYKKLAIQPMEYALQNKLDYAQANVVKYVTRHADKNGKQDLLKAIHNIELMIAHYYPDQE